MMVVKESILVDEGICWYRFENCIDIGDFG